MSSVISLITSSPRVLPTASITSSSSTVTRTIAPTSIDNSSRNGPSSSRALFTVAIVLAVCVGIIAVLLGCCALARPRFGGNFSFRRFFTFNSPNRPDRVDGQSSGGRSQPDDPYRADRVQEFYAPPTTQSQQPVQQPTEFYAPDGNEQGTSVPLAVLPPPRKPGR